MAIRSEPVEFIDDDDFNSLTIIRRVVFSIARKFQPSHIMGIFGSRGSGRTSLLNMCKDFAGRNPLSIDQKLTVWLKPFDTWKMAGMGNLTQALLWHLHRNLPEIAAKDEKVLYRLGRISVALSALTGQTSSSGHTHITHSEAVRNFELISKTLPPERKSPVSSQFSACEQIDELSESFKALGKQLAELCGCNVLVIPIDDLDKCTPSEAMELLFALRIMISGDSFSFVITADDQILSKFCNYTYGSLFTDKQASDCLLSFFNDWVHLPSPSLHTVLRKVDFPVSLRDPFFSMLESTGFQKIFPMTSAIRQGCRRFELYTYNEASNMSRTTADYCAWLGWFLIHELQPELVHDIVDSYNAEELLNSKIIFSQQPEKTPTVITDDKKESSTRIVLRPKKQVPSTTINSTQTRSGSDLLLCRFIETMRGYTDSKTMVARLRDVYPFL